MVLAVDIVASQNVVGHGRCGVTRGHSLGASIPVVNAGGIVDPFRESSTVCDGMDAVQEIE
jgi:hypothetical protein